MSSRLTIDTTNLKIRDVFCLNTLNGDYIQPGSIPVIGINGKLTWLSTIEFFSTSYLSTTKESVLKTLTESANALSNISTSLCSTFASQFTSTVTNLGTNGYVSTSFLYNSLDNLSVDYGYVSSTNLYDSFVNLADMQQINSSGVMALFLSAIGSNLSGGYVSTMNPGKYRIYKSTIALQGTNVNTSLANGGNITSGIINLAGFKNNVVNKSYLRLDINANIQLSYTSGNNLTTFSTILTNTATGLIVGDPVSLTFTNSNATLGTLSYLIQPSQLTPFPDNLQLKHIVTTPGVSINLTTNIPQVGGIFATLDNTD